MPFLDQVGTVFYQEKITYNGHIKLQINNKRKSPVFCLKTSTNCAKCNSKDVVQLCLYI